MTIRATGLKLRFHGGDFKRVRGFGFIRIEPFTDAKHY
jgi:hypothetical protein